MADIPQEEIDRIFSQITTGKRFHGVTVEPDCAHCPLRGSIKVYPDGPIGAKIALIGEGPGAKEVDVGLGLIGPTGWLTWKMAQHRGFSRDDVWVDNAALCRPRKVKLSTGATLSEEKVKWLSVLCCRKRLVGTLISVLDPGPNTVIQPLGKLAGRILTGRKDFQIFKLRGAVIPIDLQEAWVRVHSSNV